MTRTPATIIEEILRNQAQVWSLLLELTPDDPVPVPRWWLRVCQDNLRMIFQLLDEGREGV